VKEPLVEPATAVEGVACAGASTVAHGRGWSRHSVGAGIFICSGRDCIGLGMLARSLTCSIGIAVLVAVLAFNRADASLCGVSTNQTGFPLWGFSDSHVFGHFGPSLLICIEVILFG